MRKFVWVVLLITTSVIATPALAAMSTDSNSGELGRARFNEFTASLRLASLEADLSAYRYQQIILVLAKPEKTRLAYPHEASYYLDEAYHLRNEAGDLTAAEHELNRAIEDAAQFAPAHRALGLMYKREESARAAPLFRRYLELVPDVADHGHIEHYLKAIAAP